MIALSRREFICGTAAVAALATTPAVAATGIKSLPGGKTEVSLAANKALAEVGGLVEFSIKKYGKVALVRTSKATNGFAAFRLACPEPRGHGAEFGLNGALKLGPANSPLKTIKFTATSKAVTIA